MDPRLIIWLLVCNLLTAYSAVGFLFYLWPQRGLWAFPPWIFKLAVLWAVFSWLIIGDAFLLVGEDIPIGFLWMPPWRTAVMETAIAISFFVGYRWFRWAMDRQG